MYEDFSSVYDMLIKQDVKYENVADYIENLFHQYDKDPQLVCDLACGTGNITLELARRGYDMIGVDISPSMLALAKEKAEANNQDVLFLCQDLSELDLYGTCDAFLCMIDGFNYITSKNKLEKIFKKIRTCFIESDGIFIFDISSQYKLKNILGSNTYIYNSDNIFYTWENRYKNSICKMELNFFVKGDGDSYSRFEEIQIQRAYSEFEMKNTLRAAGFSKVDIFEAFDFDKTDYNTQRIVFVARP